MFSVISSCIVDVSVGRCALRFFYAVNTMAQLRADIGNENASWLCQKMNTIFLLSPGAKIWRYCVAQRDLGT